MAYVVEVALAEVAYVAKVSCQGVDFEATTRFHDLKALDTSPPRLYDLEEVEGIR